MLTALLTVVVAALQTGVEPGVVQARAAAPPEKYQAVADPVDVDTFPYQRYRTTDGFGRCITFYLSKDVPAKAAGGESNPPLPSPKPVVVCVQGSGSQSVFLEADTPQGKRIASGGPEAAVLKLARERVRVMVVEKPGVEFLVQPSRPGSAEESTAEFRREHTLERWTEALNAAIKAACSLPGMDTSRVLALGHSEGGQVVCHLAAVNPSITHVATLAGGGPTQLFDLVELARSGAMGPPDASPEARVRRVLDGWREVMKDPDSAEKMWMGHPYRRWSTFLASSPIEGILSSKARVFIGQGGADTATSPAAADVLFAELLARGRDVTYERIEGGDHGFMKADDRGEGWLDMHRKAIEWFLATPTARQP